MKKTSLLRMSPNRLTFISIRCIIKKFSVITVVCNDAILQWGQTEIIWELIYIKTTKPVNSSISPNMWYHRYELLDYLHPLMSWLCMYKPQGIECGTLVCVCVYVCVGACWVLAMFAQLQVLFSEQTTSQSFSHGLISSSNTNVNEAPGRLSNGGFFYTCGPVESVCHCLCVRCDSHTAPGSIHGTVRSVGPCL